MIRGSSTVHKSSSRIENAREILVTGNAGAGKSTLAKRLAAERDLPFFSLDGIVWQEGWKKTPPGEKNERIEELIARDSWIVDGVSTRVLQAADVVIFLDVPRWRCLWQAARRNMRYLFSSRPELPDHCPEILIIPTLWKIIWHFDARVRPGILREGAFRVADETFFHVRSATDLPECLLLSNAPAELLPHLPAVNVSATSTDFRE